MNLYLEFSDSEEYKLDEYIECNRMLCFLETCLEELDGHLIAKPSVFDDYFFNFFQLHYSVLRVRELFIKKLYPKQDRNLILSCLEEKKNCLFEALSSWPEFRHRQRNHYCCYYGATFVTANLIDKKIWPLTHFSPSVYNREETEVVRNFVHGELDFSCLPEEEAQFLYRKLNNLLLKISECIESFCTHRVFLNPSLDDIITHAFQTRADILSLRMECVRTYVGGEDGMIVIDHIEKQLQTIHITDIRTTRLQLRCPWFEEFL